MLQISKGELPDGEYYEHGYMSHGFASPNRRNNSAFWMVRSQSGVDAFSQLGS